MSAMPYMPPEAAQSVNDLLDNCAQIKPGQNVLILAANDGLYGGRNLVDQTAIAWIQAGVQMRGAHPSVLWTDMPIRRQVLWPNMPTRDNVWRIPPIVRQAMKGADMLISQVLDLSSEEELKELTETLSEFKLPMVRNMATTAPLLMSAWARTPYELITEIRYRVAEQIREGERWVLTHPNGTHLEGTVGSPQRKGGGYAYWRVDGWHRPFPEGIYPAVNPVATRGVFIFDRMMPVWARHIGVPIHFSQPVRVTVENNQVLKFEGGPEAETLTAFHKDLAKMIGHEAAHEIRAPHGGVHPAAIVSAAQCPDEDYREFIASFHPSSIHMHFGKAGKSKEFPFNLHTSAELRGATLTVGNQTLHDNGKLSVMDHPSVKAVVARYPDRPGFDGDKWLFG